MPRDGSGVYSLPSGTDNFQPGTTIESAKVNTLTEDLENALNTEWPEALGGSGGIDAITRHDATEIRGVDIATAGTLDLSTATGPFVDLTGTTTVTAVTLANGKSRLARAASAFQITAGASLIVNGSTIENLAVAAGDLLFFEGYSGDVVRVWRIGATAVVAKPAGYLFGLTLSNNGSDATNDIDIAAGAARDRADTDNMVVGSALTKQLDAAWAVGTNAGGLDTGTIADGTYHVWLIKRVDTGVVDVLFSTSATAPTMPANYTLKRRIGSILRESAAIVGFVQDGDLFERKVPVNDINNASQGTTAVLRALSIPSGLKVQALISAMYAVGAGAAGTALLITDPDQTDTAPVYQGIGDLTSFSAASGITADSGRMLCRTNTSKQVRTRGSAASLNLSITTHGWVDGRGRLA